MVWALGHDMCAATVVERLRSPDSAREAVIYEYNCGATTPFNAIVGIGSPGLDPLETSVVFSMRGQPVRLETGAYGGPIDALFRVRWTGPRDVEIRYPIGAGAQTKADRAADVTLTYVADR